MNSFDLQIVEEDDNECDDFDKLADKSSNTSRKKLSDASRMKSLISSLQNDEFKDREVIML